MYIYLAPLNCRDNCSCNIYRKNSNIFKKIIFNAQKISNRAAAKTNCCGAMTKLQFCGKPVLFLGTINNILKNKKWDDEISTVSHDMPL